MSTCPNSRSTCWRISWCRHCMRSQEDLDLEREVVLEEIAQVEDTPDDLVFETPRRAALERGHPYGRSDPGDPKESVGGIDAAALTSGYFTGTRYTWRATWWSPPPGNVDHDDSRHERVTHRLGGLPCASPVRNRRPDRGRVSDGTNTGLEIVHERASAQTSHRRSEPRPTSHATSVIASAMILLVLLAGAFGGGMSSTPLPEGCARSWGSRIFDLHVPELLSGPPESTGDVRRAPVPPREAEGLGRRGA